jgi:hypothetical protein
MHLLTKNDEKPWNYPKSCFSMLTCGLSPNFGEKLLFCNIFIFLVNPFPHEHIVKNGRFHLKASGYKFKLL